MASQVSPLTQTTAPAQTQGLFITQVVFAGRIYQIHAFIQDSAGQTAPLAIPDQATMQRVQNYTLDLFAAHERQRSASQQPQLDVIDVTSQGMIQRDHTIVSHDFLVQPIAPDIATRMEADLAATPHPIGAPAIKAQDIWNSLEQTLLQNIPSAPVYTPPSGTGAPDTHLTPSFDPFNTPPLTVPPIHSAALPSPETTTHTDSTPPPPLDTATPPPQTTTHRDSTPPRELNSTPEPSDPPVTHTPPVERREPPRTTRPRPPRDHRHPLQPRRLVLSTEHDLKNHNFTDPNWYETIPLRTRIRLCQNIMNCHSTQPMERRVWDKFQAYSDYLRTTDQYAPDTVQLIQEEMRSLQRQVSSLPQTLPRETNRLAHSILRRHSETGKVDNVLTQNINRFPVDDKFLQYFVEQIEAEQLQIAQRERADWARAHCKDEPMRFMRVLERYLDNA